MNMHSTLGERVHEIIRQNIIEGRYRPGERLFFEKIAEETGVSMTPIKEAFMLLEKEGLVVSVARKGTFVRELSKRDVGEYYQIRLALESLAVDLICANGLAHADDERFREICDSLERHIAEKDAAGCIVDDVQYHQQLVESSGNGQLGKIIGTLPLTNLFNLVKKPEYYLKHGKFFLEEHRKMVRLLRKGDAVGVKDILRKHITSGTHSIIVAMDSSGRPDNA